MMEELSVPPKVSVIMITYNHEPFIAEAIESVLMQKTTFDFEIIIGEDCSTDNTRETINAYAAKFSQKIKPLLHNKNLGMLRNFATVYQACRGEYVALLEGDNYWTDPYKLQKQVDFLNTHSDYITCFHRVEILDPESLTTRDVEYHLPEKKPYYTLDDLLEHSCFIPITSTMCRKRFSTMPEWFGDTILGDIAFHILHARYGKIGFLEETMGRHRVHKGGVYTRLTAVEILEKTIHAYTVIGTQLNLSKHISYRKGLTKHCSILFQEYTVVGQYKQAVRLIYKAFKISPKISMVILFRIVYENMLRLLQIFVQQLRVIRINGLYLLKRFCGERWYNRLKAIFHHITFQRKGE